MGRYIFKIENDQLVCKKKVNGEIMVFVANDAVNRLKAIDSIKFKRVNVSDNGITLENDKTKVFVYDTVLFEKHDYQNCLYRNMKKINKSVSKWSRSQTSNGNFVAGTVKGFATVSLLATISIAIAMGSLKDNSFVEREAVDDMSEDLDFEVSSIGNTIVNNAITNLENDLKNKNDNMDVASQGIDYGVSPEQVIVDNSTDALLKELDEPQDNSNQFVNMSFNDEFDYVKYNHVISNFYQDTEERASRWGVSTNLALGQISQESGGYVENLMQIQWNSWKDQPIKVFNFEKNEYEKIILTDHPQDFQNQGITQFISQEDLKNPKTNISIGCIILRYCFDQMEHNIIVAIQAYNFGVNNMNKVLDAAAADRGCTRSDILRNQTDTSYLNYRNIIDVGDPLYVENTLRFLQDPNEPIFIKYIDDNGEIQKSSIIINNSQSTRNL